MVLVVISSASPQRQARASGGAVLGQGLLTLPPAATEGLLAQGDLRSASGARSGDRAPAGGLALAWRCGLADRAAPPPCSHHERVSKGHRKNS